MHIKSQTSTRIILIEKSHNELEGRFALSSKGLKEAKIFIEHMGGMDIALKKAKIRKPWFSYSTSYFILIANSIWKNIK